MMDPEFESAFAVCEHVLERTRLSYMARDFAAFSRRFYLPHSVGTFAGERRIETLDDLSELFGAMCAHFDTIGVIDLNRKTVSAQFCTSDLVEAMFVSQYVLRGYRLSDKVNAHAHFRREEGVWKVASAQYATNIDAVTRALLEGR